MDYDKYSKQPGKNGYLFSGAQKHNGNRLTIEELTKQNNRLAIINQIARSINIKMTYEEIIDHFAIPLQEVISYSLLSFCLLENDKLIIKSSIPKEQKILGVGTVLNNYNSAPWRAIKEKKCFLRQDIWNDDHKFEEDDDLISAGVKSAVMAPMLVDNEVIGTLNLGSDKAFAFSENDFIFVQQLADQLAICLENNRLYHEVVEVKREWEETFKAVPDLLFVIDKNYNIVRINHDYMNKPVDKLVGKKCYEIFDYCGGNRNNCPAEEAIKTRRESSREITWNDSQKIISISAYPVFSEEEGFTRVVVYSKDVTVKRHMMAQLFQSAKLAAIGEMAAGVAHELNSPLTAVIGNAELLLRRTPVEDKPYKMLRDIKSCGQRCMLIIQNLLTFSRRDSYMPEELRINDMVENSLALVRNQIEKNGITLEKRLKPGLPPIMGNLQQLEQIIINFLLNARDALENAPEKKIAISTNYTDIDNGQVGVGVTVTDTGEGINPGHLEQIFNPFFTTKDRSKGTGLGLSVSMGIAKAHGGTIEVESKPGLGSKFVLVLPF